MHDETPRREDGGRGRRQQQGVRSEGALQVHVDTQRPGQQLVLVLIEAREGIQDGGTAPVHPGGEQVGRADAGRKGLVVVELQLARKPVRALAGCQFAVIQRKEVKAWAVTTTNNYHLLHMFIILAEYFHPQRRNHYMLPATNCISPPDKTFTAPRWPKL